MAPADWPTNGTPACPTSCSSTASSPDCAIQCRRRKVLPPTIQTASLAQRVSRSRAAHTSRTNRARARLSAPPSLLGGSARASSSATSACRSTNPPICMPSSAQRSFTFFLAAATRLRRRSPNDRPLPASSSSSSTMAAGSPSADEAGASSSSAEAPMAAIPPTPLAQLASVKASAAASAASASPAARSVEPARAAVITNKMRGGPSAGGPSAAALRSAREAAIILKSTARVSVAISPDEEDVRMSRRGRGAPSRPAPSSSARAAAVRAESAAAGVPVRRLTAARSSVGSPRPVSPCWCWRIAGSECTPSA
mmetsp:Transcript_30538/g.76484  ORF Transcript_30538/g.76484 Transcript_30538/m.76484 type:complete len:311 (+) Transcript_30538:733-1665(+)